MNEPGLPVVVLSNLACKVVTIDIVPLQRPVVGAAIAIRMLPTVELKVSEHPASSTKSSPASPTIVIVDVPVLARIKLAAALLTNFICAQVILPFANTVTAPVAGVAPPTFVPSNIKISDAPVDEGRVLPDPLMAVFQFEPVVILVEGVVPPTQ